MNVLGILIAIALAPPLVRQVDPFAVERADGSRYLNPFSGGLSQPRIGLRDADADGRPDLFALNPDGQLRYYRNEGAFRFRRVLPSPYDDVPVESWFRFADLDGDGRDDILTAGEHSEVMLLRNVGSNTDPLYQLPADTVRGADGVVITTQKETVPSLVDIDGDGDLDFFNGNLDGSITYYQNTGSRSAYTFTFRTAKFEEILVLSSGGRTRKSDDDELQGERHGASVLDFLDYDGDGDLDFLFGDFFTTKLLLFHNTGTRTAPDFDIARLDTAFRPNGDDVESEGFNQPTSGDLDGDGDLDVVVSALVPGSTRQPLTLYENIGTATAPLMRARSVEITDEIDVGTYAAPALIDDASRHGLLIGSTDGVITYFERRGSGTSSSLRLVGRYGVTGSQQTSPTAGDLDGDGDAEIVVGDAEGYVRLYRFEGSRLVRSDWQLDTFKVNQNAAPTLADLDRDGDLDLFIGGGNGRFAYFENAGSSSTPIFVRTPPPPPFNTLDVGNDATPRFCDLDRDGDLDIVVGERITGESHGRVKFYFRDGDRFDTLASWPAVAGLTNPVPVILDLPIGRYLLVGTLEGGIVAYLVDRESGVGSGEQGVGSGVRVALNGDRTITIVREAPVGSVLILANSSGEVIMRTPLPAGHGTMQLPLPTLPNGIYFWRIGDATGNVVIMR